MLVQQLKKYKSFIAAKQARLGTIESDLAERKIITDKKQKMHDEHDFLKC